jgi:hypothetical protein
MKANDFLGEKTPKVKCYDPQTFRRILTPLTEELALYAPEENRRYYVEFDD